MILSEEIIASLPIIDEAHEDFYEDGEFEAAILEDFDRAADEIDKLNDGTKDAEKHESQEEKTEMIKSGRQNISQ